MTPQAERPLLTTAEVARMLGLSTITVYRQAKMGLLPHVVVIKGERRDVIRFRYEDIEAYINERLA